MGWEKNGQKRMGKERKKGKEKREEVKRGGKGKMRLNPGTEDLCVSSLMISI